VTTSTYYSLTDLATRVGKDLGVIGAEEVPDGATTAWLSETCSAEIAMLSAIGLPIWNGSDVAVPQEYLTPLSRRIGLAAAVSYGLADPATTQLAMREAERYLTVLANPRGGNPLTLKTNDAMRRTSGFNFTTG
jgi:hypothetical protein